MSDGWSELSWVEGDLSRALEREAKLEAALRESQAREAALLAVLEECVNVGTQFFPWLNRKAAFENARATLASPSGCRKSLADPTKAKWHQKEAALLQAIEAELAGRGAE
jgi:hypothetical protein